MISHILPVLSLCLSAVKTGSNSRISIEDILNLALQCPAVVKTIHNMPPEKSVTRIGMDNHKIVV